MALYSAILLSHSICICLVSCSMLTQEKKRTEKKTFIRKIFQKCFIHSHIIMKIEA